MAPLSDTTASAENLTGSPGPVRDLRDAGEADRVERDVRIRGSV